MADITHFGFRQLVSRFSPPHLYYSEMIHSPSLICGSQFEKWYMITSDYEPLVWQLTSDETETIKDTIPLLLEKSSLGIDLNMGCPAPHIVATGAGFAWLKKERSEVARYIKNARDAIDEYIKVKKNVRSILSVKMRLPSEKQEALYDFVRFLIDCGVDRVTIHPRFQKEKYGRPPHYEYVEKLLDKVSIPIFINGDIKTANDINKISEKMPKLAGCMIGREAVRKPWIFLEIKEMEGERRIDLLEVATIFIKNLCRYQPEEFQLLRSKRFFSLFCDNFKFSHYIRTKLLNAKSLDEILPILLAYFEEVNYDRWYRL